MAQPTFIDIFAGCGGFGEGFHQAGYKPLVHVDSDSSCRTTLAVRMMHHGADAAEAARTALCGDLTKPETHQRMHEVVGDQQVDVVVGGPPCQAFSSVGRAQDPNSMRNDPRNFLFRAYLEILEHFKPRVFVFENVSGLLTARPEGHFIFPEIIRHMRKDYFVPDERSMILLNSVHYGVPQVRQRVIIIGVRRDEDFRPEDIYPRIRKSHYAPNERTTTLFGESASLGRFRTVRDAIGDLPSLLPGQGEEESDFGDGSASDYVQDVLRPNGTPTKLRHHVARRHNDQDQERYAILAENGWQLRHLAETRPDLIHHDPKHFGNRYTVQEYDLPGRTVVAHLYKDGNLFIHPDPKQRRTFTVREAARVQSFPDDFWFPVSRTDQYKQVGNAVPPLMARRIAEGIKEVL